MAQSRIHGLYVIVDPDACAGRDAASVARQAIDGGASVVQWRDKRRDKGEQLADARAIRALCAERDACFIVNDHLDLALVVSADGVHLGHIHLMRQLRDDARERGLTPVIVTLSNHPLSVLRPQAPLVLISSLRERLALLRAAGVEHVIPVTFTKELSLRTAEEFMRALCDCVGLRHFVAGPDFALGHDREGTLPVLESLGEKLGYTVRTADAFSLDGAPVRSTAVRQALSAGGTPSSDSCPVARRRPTRGL